MSGPQGPCVGEKAGGGGGRLLFPQRSTRKVPLHDPCWLHIITDDRQGPMGDLLCPTGDLQDPTGDPWSPTDDLQGPMDG